MIILVGASASGKTVIGENLIKKYGLKKFITTTTREMRPNEVNDRDYHFVSEEEFLKRINDGAFVEHVIYNNHRYGSQKSEIDNNKVLVLEARGLSSYKALNDPNIVTFYIDCDENIRKTRMLNRGDDPQDVERRIINDRKLFTEEIKEKADYIINTDSGTLDIFVDNIYNLYINKISNS